MVISSANPIVTLKDIPDGAFIVNTSQTVTCNISDLLSGVGVTLAPQGSMVKQGNGPLYASLVNPNPGETCQIVITDAITDYENPVAVAAAVAAELLKSGIPNVLVTDTLFNGVIPANGNIVLNISGYASVRIQGTIGGPQFSIGCEQSLDNPATVLLDAVSMTSMGPVATSGYVLGTLAVVGNWLLIDNGGNASPLTIAVVGSNRPAYARFDARFGETMQTWQLPNAAYVLGTTYNLTGGGGLLQGQCWLDYRITGGALKGDLFLNTFDGLVMLASHAELIAVGGASFGISKMVAVPGEAYGLSFACTAGATSNLQANLVAGSI